MKKCGGYCKVQLHAHCMDHVPNGGHFLQFGPELLEVKLHESPAFVAALLCLGKPVPNTPTTTPRDHSDEEQGITVTIKQQWNLTASAPIPTPPQRDSRIGEWRYSKAEVEPRGESSLDYNTRKNIYR